MFMLLVGVAAVLQDTYEETVLTENIPTGQEESPATEMCALICHLPPPIHRWSGYAKQHCDPEKSVYFDTNTEPLEMLAFTDPMKMKLVLQLRHRALWTSDGKPTDAMVEYEKTWVQDVYQAWAPNKK